MSKIIVGVFSCSISTMGSLSRKENKKEILDLYNTTDQMNLTDIYRVFHPMLAEYSVFLNAHGILSRIDKM